MALIINLNNITDNASLQIGDIAYYVDSINTSTSITNSSKEVQKIGEITEIDNMSITIETFVSTPPLGAFIMFSKDKRVNNTSLVGYYAEVKLSNNSTDKAELFTLNSEITASSK